MVCACWYDVRVCMHAYEDDKRATAGEGGHMKSKVELERSA